MALKRKSCDRAIRRALGDFTNRSLDMSKRPSSAQRGYGHQWRKARLRFLNANPLCRLCHEQGLIVPATEVDHIIPKEPKDMGFWDVTNWQALCEFCHKSKTARFDKPDKHKVKIDGNRGPRKNVE